MAAPGTFRGDVFRAVAVGCSLLGSAVAYSSRSVNTTSRGGVGDSGGRRAAAAVTVVVVCSPELPVATSAATTAAAAAAARRTAAQTSRRFCSRLQPADALHCFETDCLDRAVGRRLPAD